MTEEGVYSAVIIATGVLIACVAVKVRKLTMKDLFKFQFVKLFDPLRHMKIIEVNTKEDAVETCKVLLSNVKLEPVLGFDCEWVSENGKQKPVALVQLASAVGVCGLFRLCKLKQLPEELKNLLEDRKIIKVGVGPIDDAKYLARDYGVMVRGCLDLRHLTNKPTSLSGLAQEIIGVKLDKHWKIRCSDWEVDELSHRQKQYAAKDALVAVKILEKLTKPNTLKQFLFSWFKNKNKPETNIYSCYERYIDVRYKQKNNQGNKNVCVQKQTKVKEFRRGFSTRKTPLYSNCFMHAPDGELLCSCDQRKAEWYVQRGMAEVIPGEPYSIRLLFEPAGRSMNTDEGRFYTHLKQNHCVVCGAEDSYLRHNVVPREYRKHFPDVMKKHQSHDVVLMCLKCHVLCGEHNDTLRRYLADQCDAPIYTAKHFCDEINNKLQKAARALLTAGDIIPQQRKLILQDIIKKHYNTEEVTKEILEECLCLQTKLENKEYEPHGIKVVNYYINNTTGLLELEKLWREHFLKQMNPKYLPYLWSTSHNHERLAVRAAENRIDVNDLKLAGLQMKDIVFQMEKLGLSQ